MNEKRFTDIWCSETGHIGVTDCGIDKEFTSDEFEDLLNELNDENKELKYKLRNCEDARKSYKQDWKACSSYCDEYKNEIISLKDEVEGLIGENKEFKKENEQLRKLIDWSEINIADVIGDGV